MRLPGCPTTIGALLFRDRHGLGAGLTPLEFLDRRSPAGRRTCAGPVSIRRLGARSRHPSKTRRAKPGPRLGIDIRPSVHVPPFHLGRDRLQVLPISRVKRMASGGSRSTRPSVSPSPRPSRAHPPAVARPCSRRCSPLFPNAPDPVFRQQKRLRGRPCPTAATARYPARVYPSREPDTQRPGRSFNRTVPESFVDDHEDLPPLPTSRSSSGNGPTG